MRKHPRYAVFLLVVGVLTVAPAWGEPPKRAEPRAGFVQLGTLLDGLADRARVDERAPIKAGLFYLQAAQAFHNAGDDRAAKSLMEGIAAAQPLRTSWVNERWTVAMRFLPGDQQIITCEDNGRVRIRDIASGREVRSFGILEPRKPGEAKDNNPVQGAGEIGGASWNADLSRLAVWEGRTLQLWDTAKGRRLRQWDRPWYGASRGRRIPVEAGAVFLADGERLLLWGTDKPAEVWDVDGKARLATIDKGSVAGAASVSGDGSRLLTADRSTVYLWDLSNGKLIRTFETGNKDNGSMSYLFSPDGKRVLAIGGGEGEDARGEPVELPVGLGIAEPQQSIE
ncbi:MAG: WD40 repeat domain-containing protein, partial [Gemmataceae bacterium]